MDNSITITAMVCVTLVSIVCIFSILAYLKDRANLKLTHDFKHLKNEISITTSNNKNQKNSIH